MKITNKLKLMLKSILSLQLGEIETDKAKLYFDGADLAEGMEVFVEDEEGNFNPAPDGDYVTEDNKTIVVVEGKVSEIKDPEAEVASEPETEKVEEVKAEEAEEIVPADEPETEEKEVTIEDRVSALEAKAEEIVNALNEIVNAISALEARITEAEGKLAQVEAPATNPIDETPEIEERKTRLSYIKRK